MDDKVVFKNFRGLDIKGILSYPEEKDKIPGVIISHGFLSFKEYKLLYKIADKLTTNGIAALRYDFSGCIGESEGECSDMMLSHELNDLVSAITFMENNEKIDAKNIGLAGHSLGAMASIIVASNEPRIKSIVAIASPAKLEWQKAFGDEFIKMWEHDKKAMFRTAKKGDVEIDFSFYKDYQEYDAEKIIKKLQHPIRFIHGQKDNIVDIKNAEALFKAAPSKKDLKIIPQGDHMFLDKELSDKVSALTLEWLKETLI